MKTVLAAAVIFASASAMANPVDVSPSSAQFLPSQVVQSLLLQPNTWNKDGTANARISLIKIDKGGGSDVPTKMSPNELRLGIHLDGEEFNTDGNYLLDDNVDKITSASYDSKTNLITVVVTQQVYANPGIKSFSNTLTVNVSDALKEADSAISKDSKPYNLKTVITEQSSITGSN
jgi:hypothetical protein